MTIDGRTIQLPDGRRVGYLAAGPADGRPVLYFHGCPGARVDLLLPGVERDARSHGLRLIAPERPGYGLSDVRRGRRVVDWVDDVRLFADALGIDRFSVYGFSAGGPHALACAARLSDRVTSVVTVCGVGVAGVSGYFDGMAPSERLLHRLGRLSPRLVGPAFRIAGRAADRYPRRLFRFFEAACSPTDKALLADADTRAALRRIFQEAVRSGTTGVVEDWAALSRRPWGFAPEEVRIPAYLFFGDVDMFVPVAQGRDLARRIPNASVIEVRGEGHLLVIGRRGEVFAALAGTASAQEQTGSVDGVKNAKTE